MHAIQYAARVQNDHSVYGASHEPGLLSCAVHTESAVAATSSSEVGA